MLSTGCLHLGLSLRRVSESGIGSVLLIVVGGSSQPGTLGRRRQGIDQRSISTSISGQLPAPETSLREDAWFAGGIYRGRREALDLVGEPRTRLHTPFSSPPPMTAVPETPRASPPREPAMTQSSLRGAKPAKRLQLEKTAADGGERLGCYLKPFCSPPTKTTPPPPAKDPGQTQEQNQERIAPAPTRGV